MGKVNLVNENIDNSNSSIKIEQYKLYVQMMDKISDRRGIANSFFIGLNTIIISVIGIMSSNCIKYWWLIILVGCSISCIWDYILRSYKLLNTGKFIVIHEMERELCFNCYAYEWQVLGRGEDKRKYLPISHIEKIVPKLLFIIYLIVGIVLCVNN